MLGSSANFSSRTITTSQTTCVAALWLICFRLNWHLKLEPLELVDLRLLIWVSGRLKNIRKAKFTGAQSHVNKVKRQIKRSLLYHSFFCNVYTLGQIIISNAKWSSNNKTIIRSFLLGNTDCKALHSRKWLGQYDKYYLNNRIPSLKLMYFS